MRYLIAIFFLFMFGYSYSKSNKTLDKGFYALGQYDYFKAKAIFNQVNKKEINFAASYGLSLIFYRNDNPFTNSDSALKYINMAYQAYLVYHKFYTYYSIKVDSLAILKLADSVSSYQFNKALRGNTVFYFDKFLKENFLANTSLRSKAVKLRDELEFIRNGQINKSDSTIAFMLKHPLSFYYGAASLLLDRQIFAETTLNHVPDEWINFLKKYPTNIMVNEAYERLFEYYRKNKSAKGLAQFVKNYPKAPQILEAWKLLFSLSVKEYNSEELQNFLTEYPKFPLKNSILREMELNKIVLFPFQKDDYTGFIDANGKIFIEAQFDHATDFHEGLSVVSKNDSVFFINKERINPFNQFYSEAFPFNNGIAAVKQNGKWFFINRQGQVFSKNYEEINEPSGNLYVFKLNDKYGALDLFGQVFMEAKFDKLGDFKNDAAYFTESGKFGFVTVSGRMHRAEFDWISDFDEQQLAIYKIDNKYGLINLKGYKLLENNYDQIIKMNEQYFMLINNNQYGFYSSGGCFVTPVAYEYNKEKSNDYYCQDNLFKLIKKAEQIIVDDNGHVEINSSLYNEVNFMNNGLMLVKRKGKYGFIDKKMNVVIPFKYQEAQSFKDSLCIVKLKNKFQILDISGKELYVSESPVLVYNKNYFISEDETKTLINRKGEVVMTDIASIQAIKSNMLIVTLSNGELKLLKD